MSFLDLETKQDSAAKVAAAEGKPHEEFLWADDVNLMRDKINQLRQIVAMMSLPLSQLIAEGELIDLGDIGETTVKNAINARNPVIMLGNNSPTFVKALSNERNQICLFSGAVGNYGVGGLQATDADLELLYDTVADLSAKFHALVDLNITTPGDPAEINTTFSNEIAGLTITKTVDTGAYIISAPGLNVPKKASVLVQSKYPIFPIMLDYQGEDSVSLIIADINGNPSAFGLDHTNIQIEKFL